MTALYPAAVKKAIDRGQVNRVTRRVEVYESDAVSPWSISLEDRLVDGSVNLTYGDNERRIVDLTLRNDDNLLRSQPTGFWYDKILKVYRGIEYSPSVVPPSVAVIETVGGLASSGGIIGYLARVGLPGAVFKSVPDVSDLMDYDIIVSYTGNVASTQLVLLSQLYDAGKSIITIGNRSTVIGVADSEDSGNSWGIDQMPNPSSLGAGWSSETVSTTLTGNAIMSLTSDALAVARHRVDGVTWYITAHVAMNGTGGKWFNLQLPNLGGSNTQRLFANVIDWFNEDHGNWETQIGEFGIDAISSPYFPQQVKVTGRDYTKKCMSSKIENPMNFAATTSVGQLISALAGNAGIKKYRMSSMPETIGSEMTFDRGTARWEVMVAAANTQGYEIFFDSQGYLVTRKYLDPTLSPENYLFQTGAEGNLASIDRSVNDSRIYNHIVVYGDPASGETRLPYVGEAKNLSSGSPTSIAKIGDRYYSYASTFFSSQLQCQQYAERLLGIHSLESFELSFQAINYPWMEVGEIAKVNDPQAVSTDPTKYLVDSATIPLTLGPMSFTGKRVLAV